MDACARVVTAVSEVVAVVGGEGSRLFAQSIREARVEEGSVCEVLDGDPDETRAQAFGEALAGRRVTFVASGAHAVHALTPTLAELERLGVAALVVIPAHGEECGRSLPREGMDDVRVLLDAPVGVLVADSIARLVELVVIAWRIAGETMLPWALAFELHTIGCGVERVVLPTPDEALRRALPAAGGGLKLKARGARVALVADMVWDAFRDAGLGDGPVVREGSPEAPDVVVALGSRARKAGRAARAQVEGEPVGDLVAALGVLQLRPFPVAAIERGCTDRADVLVDEAFPDALGTPRLTTLLRSVLGRERVHPLADWSMHAELSAAEESVLRVDLVWPEPERGAMVLWAVEFLASAGFEAHVRMDEPWGASVEVSPWTDDSEDRPSRVCLMRGASPWSARVLESLPEGSLVMAFGELGAEETARVATAARERRVRVIHQP
jgi:hypothetical protein